MTSFKEYTVIFTAPGGDYGHVGVRARNNFYAVKNFMTEYPGKKWLYVLPYCKTQVDRFLIKKYHDNEL